jgi:lactate dehydrogenase-like 2-hydroxyacid dehydrogenase
MRDRFPYGQEIHAASTAELALALLLGIGRNVSAGDHLIRGGAPVPGRHFRAGKSPTAKFWRFTGGARDLLRTPGFVV